MSSKIYAYAVLNALFLTMFDAFYSGVLQVSFPYWYYYAFLNFSLFVPAVVWSMPLLDYDNRKSVLNWMINIGGLYCLMNGIAVFGYDFFLWLFNYHVWLVAYISQQTIDLGANVWMATKYYFLDAEIELWLSIPLLHYARKWHYNQK